MDDRFYLAVYDEKRIQPLIHAEDYVCDVVLPSYRFCEVNGNVCCPGLSKLEGAVCLLSIHKMVIRDTEGIINE